MLCYHKDMKKKKSFWLNFLIRALCLCLCFVFLTGGSNSCGQNWKQEADESESGEGGEGGDEGDDEELEPDEDGEDEDGDPVLLSGLKALSRPEDYDFSKAVGDYSENYFNIFSRYILYYLQEVYGGKVYKDLNRMIYTTAEFFKDAGDEEDVKDWTFVETDETNNKYAIGYFNEHTDVDPVSWQLYFTDTIRYTFDSVRLSDDSQKQIIELNASKGWNWGANITDAKKTIFVDDQLDYEPSTKLPDGNGVLKIEVPIEALGLEDWTEFDELASVDYSSLYYFNGDPIYKMKDGAVVVVDGQQVVDYYGSPAYETVDAINYYQDALEYVVYLIALGYNTEDDAAFFDFDIPNALKNYNDSPITVGGWGADKINIKLALQNVKEKYRATVNYIGVSHKNVVDITKFILENVIGEDSPDTFSANGKTFYRNYAPVVYNIVKYACEEAPIGGKEVDGTYRKASLSDSFLTSKITDYVGDSFSISNDEDNLFSNIEAAEYQSLVFFPQQSSIGKTLGNVWLLFEYYELPDGSTKVMDEENGITINVGFRYFDNVQNKLIEAPVVQVHIDYSKNGAEVDKTGTIINPNDLLPVTEVFIGEDEECDSQFGEEVVINTGFDNSVGNDAINALKNGEGEGSNTRSITLGGGADAKDYYKLNDSTSYGQYGTLNEAKFVGVCDFIEIYFDIQKDKDTSSNKCYAFKVAATLIVNDDE